MKGIFGNHLLIEERKFIHSLIFPGCFVLVLFAIKLVEDLEGYSFVRYGIIPHSRFGFMHIFTAPLIHKDWAHLFGNSTSILILGSCLFFFYSKAAYHIFFTIWVLAGIGLWIGGREVYHIGASGIVYGMVVFLILGSIIRRNKPLAAISFLVVLFYGSFIWGMLPLLPNLPYSWEAHLWGALSGVAATFLFKDVPPSGVFKEEVYSFDNEEEVQDSNEERYWEIPPNDTNNEEDN